MIGVRLARVVAKRRHMHIAMYFMILRSIILRSIYLFAEAMTFFMYHLEKATFVNVLSIGQPCPNRTFCSGEHSPCRCFGNVKTTRVNEDNSKSLDDSLLIHHLLQTCGILRNSTVWLTFLVSPLSFATQPLTRSQHI